MLDPISPGRQPRIGILKHMRLWGAEQLRQQQLEAGTRLVGRVQQQSGRGSGGSAALPDSLDAVSAPPTAAQTTRCCCLVSRHEPAATERASRQ